MASISGPSAALVKSTASSPAGVTGFRTSSISPPSCSPASGVAVYVAGPSIQKLADSHAFTGIASLLIILFLLALNVRGLSLGKWINNLGALGTIGGAAMICLLAALTLHHNGSALHPADLRTGFHDWRLFAAFGTICYSLVGLDLASIMGDEIRDPRRNLPISILLGGLIAGFIYFGTTLSMLIAMPQKEIGVLSGVLQAINVMSARNRPGGRGRPARPAGMHRHPGNRFGLVQRRGTSAHSSPALIAICPPSSAACIPAITRRM